MRTSCSATSPNCAPRAFRAAPSPSNRNCRLFAIAEAYPELKADANFRDLQEKLAGIEDEIQLSRRYYNGAVRNFNTMIESFPSNFIADFFRFAKAEFFEIGDQAARQVPKVEFNKAS